jgi:hypothetical protein
LPRWTLANNKGGGIMKRFISLLSIVLTLSLLAAGCKQPTAEKLNLKCNVDRANNELVIEIAGKPGHYWMLFWSTSGKDKGKGDFLSREVRLDLIDVHRVEDDEKGMGQFYGTELVPVGTPVTFPLKDFKSGTKIWFQAISAEEVYIFQTDMSKDEVEISETCEVKVP